MRVMAAWSCQPRRRENCEECEAMGCMDRRMGVLLMAFMIYHFSTGGLRIQIDFRAPDYLVVQIGDLL